MLSKISRHIKDYKNKKGESARRLRAGTATQGRLYIWKRSATLMPSNSLSLEWVPAVFNSSWIRSSISCSLFATSKLLVLNKKVGLIAGLQHLAQPLCPEQ